MHYTNETWRQILTVGLALALALAVTNPSSADAIDELRQALALDDVIVPTDAVLRLREANLTKKVEALKTIGEMRRGLALNDWRDGPEFLGVANNPTREIDGRVRAQLGNRLTEALKMHARSDDPIRRKAVSSLLAEIGASMRALKPGDKRGFAAAHLDIVEKLVGDRDPNVQQEALRALGTINADAKRSAQIFAGVLRRQDASVPARRLAAEGLAQMTRVAIHFKTNKDTNSGVSAESFDILPEVIAAAPAGFDNPDVRVRIVSLEAFQLACQLLNDAVKENYTDLQPRNFPAANRELSAEEEEKVGKLYREVQAEVDAVGPFLKALKSQTGKLTPTLRDSSPEVRLAGVNCLNQIAGGWQRLRRYVLAIPIIPKSQRQTGRDRADLIAGIDPFEVSLKQQLDAIGPLMSEPDSRLRRAAATFLMLLDDRAAPMLPYLVTTLTDADRAIRWISARSLQNLSPAQIESAVPNLARLLGDPDLTLRMIAAETLRIMGPHARAAVGALADATLKGDADGRVAAMSAITALGPKNAQAAVPKLVEVLNQSDAEPKIIAGAAETLGQMGAAARSAVPALERLTNHDSPEVRLAASEAILSVMGNGDGSK